MREVPDEIIFLVEESQDVAMKPEHWDIPYSLKGKPLMKLKRTSRMLCTAILKKKTNHF